MAHYYIDINGNASVKKDKKKRYVRDETGRVVVVTDASEEEDIAPVRETAKKKEKEDDSKLDLFQKGLFDDGYDAGDITKTILGTAGDIGLGFVKGVAKIGEGKPDIMDLIESGKIDYIVSTSSKGRTPEQDDVRIRRKAVEHGIPCLTAIDTAKVIVDMLSTGKVITDIDVVDITKI
jgi:hypothetical protein